jgi:hypothetical protein
MGLCSSAIEYPPVQKGESFNLEAVKEQIETAVQARFAVQREPAQSERESSYVS